jgi:uncharacterized membrane protein
MKNKHLIVIESALIAMTVVLVIFVSSGSCAPSLVNPIMVVIIVQISGMVVMLLVFLKLSSEKKSLPGIKKFRERVAQDIEAGKLEGHEKRAYGIIKESNGAILQADLIKRIGLSKVKVTRILDKLERKGLTERRRRGLKNIVLLRK